jgi:hypothetical protein
LVNSIRMDEPVDGPRNSSMRFRDVPWRDTH